MNCIRQVFLWIAIGVFAAEGWCQSMPASSLRVGIADTMVKVPLEQATKDAPLSAEAIAWNGPARISLARNEREGIQIVIASTDAKPLRNVRVSVEGLSGSGKSPWPADEIVLWRVGHVEVYNLWASHNRLGWFPDPLTTMAGAFDVPANENATVLVEFHATHTQAAGGYTGVLTVQAEGVSSVRIPLEVTVHDFAVPTEQHFTLAIPTWGAQMEAMYGKAVTPEQRRRYLAMLLEHRVSPFAMSSDEMTFCYERGMRDFNLVCLPNDHVPDDCRKRIEDPYRAWKALPWSSDSTSYVLLGDECPPAAYPYLKEQGRIARDISKDIVRRFTLTAENTTQGFKYAFRELAGSGDTVILGAGPGGLTPKLTAQARRHGFKVWWYYVACHYYIPTPGTEARSVFWRHWKYHVPGQLHWGLSYWGDANIAGKDGKKWPDVPWDGKLSRGGDGYLTYPAPGGGIYLPSLRLKIMRDGVEDYEYFWLLDHLTQKLAKQTDEPAVRRVAENRKILDISPRVVESYEKYSEEPKAYRAYRQKVADAIVATQKLIAK